MSNPEVSVVMSVFNGADTLERSVESVLNQRGVGFEFIIINDGSTDGSAKILHEYAGFDNRIKVIEQKNLGLTKALIKGCAKARGEYIARQDASDVSRSNRLKAQIEFLKSNRDYNCVSCYSNVLSPEGEMLYVANITETDLQKALKSENPRELFGPSHHGSALFKKSDYDFVGGYRKEFYFAQDIDLWTRLIEVGNHGVVAEVLYDSYFYPSSLTGLHVKKQKLLKEIVAGLVATRRRKGDEHQLLAKAAKIRPNRSAQGQSRRLADSNYFIGSCLVRTSPRLSRKYFKECLKHDPLHFKGMLKYLQSLV